MEPVKTYDKIWNPIFISVFIANVCISLGQFMMFSLIPKFAYSLGASATVVGWVSSIFTITALLIRPFSSPASDSFSKKKMLILCLLDVLVSFIIYGFAHTIPVIIVARLIQGVGTGCITPLCLAMAGDALPRNKLGSGIGVYMIGQSIAQAIGPNIGLNLTESIGYNKTFFIGAAVLLLGIIICIPMKEVPHPKKPYKISVKGMIAREALPYSVLMMLISIANATISSYIAIYAGIMNVENIGLYFTVNAVALLAIRPIAGKISDTRGFDKVIIPGTVIYAAAFVILSQAKSLPVFLLAAVISAIGNGFAYASIQSVSLKKVPIENRGAGTSTNYIFVDIANLVGPLLSGFLVDAFLRRGLAEYQCYSRVYLVMVIPLAISFIVSIVMRKELVALEPTEEKTEK